MNSLPEARSPIAIILMTVVIQAGGLNIGYVITYLTLSINTLFANLKISESERTHTLSLLNGILPLGCLVGVIGGYFMKRSFTNKQCMFIADAIGMLNLLTLISKLECIIAFRFFLGTANGISSLIMPVYVKSICPDIYFQQVSMILGYAVNTGVMIGQLMGIGYIDFHGNGTSYWRVVLFVPSLVCLTRSSIIYFFFNYDSPEQLILKGKTDEALDVVKHIYKDEYVEQMLQSYQKQADIVRGTRLNFFHVFHKQNFITLQIGLITMMVQIWCGSYAVFYYSAQIFEVLSGGDLKTKTIYTICIGIFSFVAQFLTVYLIKPIGSKYLLSKGNTYNSYRRSINGYHQYCHRDYVKLQLLKYLIRDLYFDGIINHDIFSNFKPCRMGIQFINQLSIIPQINGSDATFLSMVSRWFFQAVLIFLFPYMVESIKILGSFLLFGVLNIIYAIYTLIFIIDSRGMTNSNLVQQYQIKYRVLPLDTQERQQ